MRRFVTPLMLSLAFGCGVFGCNPPPAAVSPPSPSVAGPGGAAPAAPTDDVFAVSGELTQEALPAAMPNLALVPRAFPAVPAGLPPAPPACAAFVARQPEAASCDDRASALDSLSTALANTNAALRDAQLAGLETCGELPTGMARALRAELAPDGCADVIVATLASSPPSTMSGAVHDALVGLGLAGMLSRAATHPPKMTAKPTKDTVNAFMKSEMTRWVQEQATAIQQIATVGAKLRYYGKAVVAVEAGMAEMRFVEAARSVPVPEEFAGDDDLRETYLQSLEVALGPRKERGRDAALVGLGSLATVGVLRDPRVERARTLLSRMFGGRPMNALDTLLLPPLAPVERGDAEQQLAARLQTFYASLVFPGAVATDPSMLRRLIEKGLSLPHRIALAAASEAALTADVRLFAARARLELGQNYWRRVDFDEATRLLARRPSGMALSGDGKLILAVAMALRGGHENAADMMVKAPLSELGIGHVDALDAVTREGGSYAGVAAFDAALIKQLAAPVSASADYWHDLGRRYTQAEGLLEDIRHQKLAHEGAQEANDTAAALERLPEP